MWPSAACVTSRRWWLAAVTAALLVLTAAASGQIIQTFGVKVSPRVASKPITLRVNETTKEDAAPQPPPMTRQVIYLQRGGKFNGRRFRHCRLSKLRKKGPKGCPKSSRIGTGRGTGSAKPILGNVSAKLTLFNGTRSHGRDRIFVFVFPDIGPTFVVVGTVKKRKGRYGLILSAKLPQALISWGRVTGLAMKMRRVYGYRGKRRSFISAGCPAPKGFPGALFTLARTSFRFEGVKLDQTLTEHCGVSR